MNPERRSDEPDADVVSFQPRFPLQELIFAHCPYQPPRPIRWNFLTKSDWLSLRRIADTDCVILPIQIIANESPLRRGKHQLSVRHSDTHLSQHCTDISHARSVSVQETAVTVVLCRGQPSRGRHTGATSSNTQHCLSRLPCCLAVSQHERTRRHHLRGNGRNSRPRRLATFPLARGSRYRLPAVANSADPRRHQLFQRNPLRRKGQPTLRREKQPALRISPVRQHLIFAPHHGTNHHNFTHLLSPLSLKTRTRSMAALQDKRADAWASPKQFHQYAHRYACQYATKFRAEMQRDESREWTVLPKKEPSNRNIMPAKHKRKKSGEYSREAR